LHRASQGDRHRAAGGHHHQRGARLAGRLRAPLSGYLDLVRAVVTRERTAKAQETLMEEVAEFVLKKHPDAFQRVPEQDAD
jgi:hypothetical protein